MIDRTIIRAHHLAAGAKEGLKKRDFSLSKGGFTTNIHLITNALGSPFRVEITGGEVSDYKGYDLLYDEEHETPKI